jgi:energy-coupling factor transporter ATP-binding protein EcfA2
MGLRKCAIEQPAPGTCEWPLEHPEYRAWLEPNKNAEDRGLLCLIGHPGSGKSVLVKALATACAADAKCPENHVATFFFNARGSSDQKSMLGLLKSLLMQLLPICATSFKDLVDLLGLKISRGGGEGGVEWYVEELKEALLKLCSVQRNLPIYMFVDAIDECEDVEDSNTNARSIAVFLRDLADKAHHSKSKLNICMSSRPYPTVSIQHCAEISVDVQNHGDIERYVSRELDQYELESSTKFDIQGLLTSKAAGVFLWARLVLNSIAQRFDDGLSLDLSSALNYLEELPKTIHQLFDRIIQKLSSQERLHALRLFQWALFAQRPLSADEWIHILALVDEPELHSIKEWRKRTYGVGGGDGEAYRDRDRVREMDRLTKRLRKMTGGLLEVVLQEFSQEDDHSEVVSSMRPISLASVGSARAGSTEPYGPATFVVESMHLSACQYFITGNGFKSLGQGAPPACFGSGHIYIASVCLRYTQLDEIKPLIPRRSSSSGSLPEASNKRLKRQRNKSDTNLSVVSFGSSAANSVRRSSLPASAPPSISGNAKSDELFEKSHSQLTRELLETHTRALKLAGDDPENEPEEDAHSHPEQLEDFRAESFVTNSYGSFSENSTGDLMLNDPALRLYAVEMFVHHVAAANQAKADPSELLDMIHGTQASEVNGCWHKWCQLNDDDDLRSDTTPAYFAAAQNLHSWIKWHVESQSHQLMLSTRGGNMRYPLLAAIARGHKPAMACMSGYINAEVYITDAWTMLHHLAADAIDTNGPVWRRMSSRGVTWKVLSLRREDKVLGPGFAFSSRLRSYMTKSRIGSDDFADILAGIRVLNSTVEFIDQYQVQMYRTEAENFLDEVFQRLGC